MKQTQKLTLSALLIALGIAIPMFMPKFVMEPASFTLASHVPVMLAMLISPGTALAVVLGTSAGFYVSTSSPVIVLRAASHLVFALAGSSWLRRRPAVLAFPLRVSVFSLVISLLHAACEVLVTSAFYLGGGMGASYYEGGFGQTILLLVGVGTAIHSVVDFAITIAVYKALEKTHGLSAIALHH